MTVAQDPALLQQANRRVDQAFEKARRWLPGTLFDVADAASESQLRAAIEQSAEIADITQQMLEVAAIVREAVSGLGIQPVVVGGLAIAYWAPGAYLTQDIDVVMPRLPGVYAALEGLGFERRGRVWVLPGREIIFEAPSSALLPRADGFVEVELASGRRVVVQTVEEVFLLRLGEFVSEGNADVFQQCLWLLGAPSMDFELLERRAEQEGLSEALKVLVAEAEEIKAGRGHPEMWELKALARRLK